MIFLSISLCPEHFALEGEAAVVDFLTDAVFLNSLSVSVNENDVGFAAVSCSGNVAVTGIFVKNIENTLFAVSGKVCGIGHKTFGVFAAVDGVKQQSPD